MVKKIYLQKNQKTEKINIKLYETAQYAGKWNKTD